MIIKKRSVLSVYCSITYNNQDMETTHVSTDRWMEKKLQ